MIETANIYYEGFEYPITQLSKFILTAGIFTIMLKNSSKIISYTPDDTEGFREWLLSHDVADIRKTG